jgi:hypothetical protein
MTQVLSHHERNPTRVLSRREHHVMGGRGQCTSHPSLASPPSPSYFWCWAPAMNNKTSLISGLVAARSVSMLRAFHCPSYCSPSPCAGIANLVYVWVGGSDDIIFLEFTCFSWLLEFAKLVTHICMISIPPWQLRHALEGLNLATRAKHPNPSL